MAKTYDVICAHTMVAGGKKNPPGSRVQIPTKEEAEYLVEIGEASWPDPDIPAEIPDAEFPEDFPARAELVAAGVLTFDALEDIEDVTSIKGIGKGLAAKIAEALEEFEGENEDDDDEGDDAEGEDEDGGDAEDEDEDDEADEPGEPGLDAVEI